MAAKQIAWGFSVPAIIGGAIAAVMGGALTHRKKDEDNIDLAENILIGSQAQGATSMIPIPGAGALINKVMQGKASYGRHADISPVFGMADTLGGVPGSVGDALNKSQKAGKAIRDVGTLLAVLGVPIFPVTDRAAYLTDVATGKAHPTGPIDFTRGVLTGKAGGPKERKW